jgi:hypothetical protein
VAGSHTFYLYLLPGATSDAMTNAIHELTVFQESRTWYSPDVWLVNQATEDDSDDAREVGLNFQVTNLRADPGTWFPDVQAVVELAHHLRSRHGTEFVLGVADQSTGVAEDIAELTSPDKDLGYIRTFLLGTDA